MIHISGLCEVFSVRSWAEHRGREVQAASAALAAV